MSYDVAVTGALLVSWAALGLGAAAAIRARAQVCGNCIEPGPVDIGRAACCDSMTTAPVAVSFADETWEAFATHPALSSGSGIIDAGPTDSGRAANDLDNGFGDYPADDFVMDDRTRAAITACLFAAPRADHVWWTVMVVDPALHDTPSHIRLVGHYETELAAVDAADVLGVELNSCLVAGEAALTTTPLGIEPEVAISRPGPRSRPPVRQPESSHISPV